MSGTDTAGRGATRGRPALLDPHLDQLLEWERRGVPVQRQAEALGVSPRTITRYRVEQGITQPRPGNRRKPPETIARAGELLADGQSVEEISRTLNIDPGTIRRHYPDAPRWTKSQAGQQGGLIRWLNRINPDCYHPTKQRSPWQENNR